MKPETLLVTDPEALLTVQADELIELYEFTQPLLCGHYTLSESGLHKLAHLVRLLVISSDDLGLQLDADPEDRQVQATAAYYDVSTNLIASLPAILRATLHHSRGQP